MDRKKKHDRALKPRRFMDILTCRLDVHSELQARLSSKVRMWRRCGETERQIQITAVNKKARQNEKSPNESILKRQSH